MMKNIFLTIIFIILNFTISAQDGYWQQKVNYNINVRLDDEKHFLHASEEIEYINNSPDQLEFIWFHLWPNAYKNRHTAYAKQQIEEGSTQFYFADESSRGYIDSLNFKINGEQLKWAYHPDHIDIAKVFLNQPLAPGEKVVISTPFRVKIPASFSRLGHIQQQYQITQWYPKPAVYDQDGWHPMPYLNQGEFYSEFGRFEVNITLPKNYVVGATGNLQTKSEKTFLDTLAEEKWQESIYRYSAPFQQSAEEMKTITYVQENVHDFAWFADKRYRVMKGSMQLPHTGREVTMYALYMDANFDAWENVLEYMEDALYYFSLWIGDYPYDVMTVVDGSLGAGAGMEYPTITVLSGLNELFLEMVTMHEIGHNWFYGALGTNERKYAWMDEGTTSFYEKRYMKTKYPDLKLLESLGMTFEEASFFRWISEVTDLDKIPYEEQYLLEYLASARKNLDQKLDLNANKFLPFNYGAIVYRKSAVIFTHLMQYLGQDEFDRIMKQYYDQWKFKHPKPEDLRAIFEKESGKDLSWFFDDLIKTDKKINYAVKKAKIKNNELVVTLKNKSSVNSPLPLVAFNGTDTISKKFVEGFERKKEVVFNDVNIDKVVIDPDHNTIDLYRDDNEVGVNEFLPQFNPVRINPIGGIDLGKKAELYFIPTFGLNTNDKFMLGAAFYNNVFPQQKFNYLLMPMYSFGLNKLAGSAEVNYNIFPRKVFHQVKLQGLAESYAGYEKLQPRLELTIKPVSLKYSPMQTISFDYTTVTVNQEQLPQYEKNYNIWTGSYKIEDGDALFKYNFNTEVQTQMDKWMVWHNELNLQHQYSQNKFLHARLFYGKFINADQVHPSFEMRLSGSYDYMMETVFLDRAMISDVYTGFEVQTDLRHGGFRSFVPVSTNQWLASMNLELDIPFIGLFSLYGDFGLTGTTEGLFYSTGLKFPLIGNILIFYIPVVGDSYPGNFPDDLDQIGEQIRFTFDLDELNPFKALERTWK